MAFKIILWILSRQRSTIYIFLKNFILMFINFNFKIFKSVQFSFSFTIKMIRVNSCVISIILTQDMMTLGRLLMKTRNNDPWGNNMKGSKRVVV